MTEHELNRAIQYVTATTSYGRATVDAIVRTCLAELSALAANGSHVYTRETLMEYVCQWTIRRTGQPEPLVREVLGCAARWLDEVYAQIATRQPELIHRADDEGG